MISISTKKLIFCYNLIMINWIHQFNEAKFQTKFFIITALLFGILIVGTMIYCYTRLFQ